MKKVSFISLLLVLSPSLAFAQTPVFGVSNITAFAALVNAFNNSIVAAFSTLFIALCVVAFFFGTAQFILGSRDANPDKMKNGKQFMLWGVIALFVAFSVYGIIIFFQGTLGIQGKTDIKIPRVIFDGSSSSNGQTPTGNGGLPTGGNQLSCPANGYATNCATYAALNCGQIRCTLGNADGYCQGTSCVPVSNGNAECAGKPVGQGCTTGGRPGTCGYDDQGTFGCYALSGVNLNKKANGVSCTSGSECNSGYCDSVANVCADLP